MKPGPFLSWSQPERMLRLINEAGGVDGRVLCWMEDDGWRIFTESPLGSCDIVRGLDNRNLVKVLHALWAGKVSKVSIAPGQTDERDV